LPTEPVAALQPDDDDDDEVAVETKSPATSDISTDSGGGSRVGLWIAAAAVVALVVGGFVFKDAIFGGGEPDPGNKGAPIDKGDKVDKGDDGGKAPEPAADTGKVEPTDTGAPETGPEPTDTGAPDTGAADTGAPEPTGELTPEQLSLIDDKLKAARRNLKTFRRTDNAMKLIEEILEIAPNHAPTLLLRAEVLANDNKLDEALSAARRAKLADPELPEIFSTLGALLEAAGDKAGALESYQRYLELDPKGPQAAAVKKTVTQLQRELGG
jgi:hypothetical protein